MPGTSHARLAALLAVGALPWTVVVAGDDLTLVFSFALVNPSSLHATDVLTYATALTRGLPQFLLSWPIGTVIYAMAVASAVSGALFDREDRRVTALLLVLVGLTQLSFAWGFSRRLGQFAVPLGTALCWTVVLWFDRETLRHALPASA